MEWKDDPEFFKEYLKQHPNDKFAWYLLGKEYLSKGEDGKAAYCFTQAGEIYKAFENDEHPYEQRIKQALENNKNSIQAMKERHKYVRRISLAALILLLLLLPSWGRFMDHAEPSPADSDTQEVTSIGEDTGKLEDFSGIGFTYVNQAESPIDNGQALHKMMGSRQSRLENNLLLAGHKSIDGKWNVWPSIPKLLLSVQTSPKGGSSTISYYDAKSCQCEPESGKQYESNISKWKQEQEEEAVLRSAMLAYEVRNGVKPSKAEQLIQPYPNNILSGLTPHMLEVFANKGQAAGAAKPANGGNTNESSSQPSSNKSGLNTNDIGASDQPLTEPLAIIVDRQNYHLAVVSEQMIVRSFPVGLGGDKTPEGNFVISEKVRNPNGKSNGDFGSRGMTLSDTLYAIHGTNEPDSIHKDESLGCIRMRKEDVEELFAMIPLETKVTIGTNLLPPLPPSNNEGKGEGDSGAQPGSKPEPFQLPSQTEERNPNKIYKWL